MEKRYFVIMTILFTLSLSAFAREIADATAALTGMNFVMFNEGFTVPTSLRAGGKVQLLKSGDLTLSIPEDTLKVRHIIFQDGKIIESNKRLAADKPYCVLAIEPGNLLTKFEKGQVLQVMIYGWTAESPGQPVLQNLAMRSIYAPKIKKSGGVGGAFGVKDGASIDIDCWNYSTHKLTAGHAKAAFGNFAKFFDTWSGKPTIDPAKLINEGVGRSLHDEQPEEKSQPTSVGQPKNNAVQVR